MDSPWVERNLDSAQYAQPRGSQYEGPKPVYSAADGEREFHDRELDEWRERAIVTSPTITTSLGWSPSLATFGESIGYAIATLAALNLINLIRPLLDQIVAVL